MPGRTSLQVSTWSCRSAIAGSGELLGELFGVARQEQRGVLDAGIVTDQQHGPHLVDPPQAVEQGGRIRGVERVLDAHLYLHGELEQLECLLRAGRRGAQHEAGPDPLLPQVRARPRVAVHAPCCSTDGRDRRASDRPSWTWRGAEGELASTPCTRRYQGASPSATAT